ncbi:head completion/stabilization protein [Dickeya solani]|uniref:Head completion/stabilization protein n=1 Tax=Dickeya solani TaxID=1089444 RepID=A0ABU4EE82_9GAMM|nr:head completion/stabilization protein [Dickeya solani]MCA7001652.1 head completion/stabilization protein [Dickeya solani]MCZ0821062.1 head completion/stabilization protein [Dickeya solani]MDV6997437.1 head completion/stabilization protein [Dickeya solani]MDV7003065.1 head completion/stabilization protein [Dickeya solani]MDV7040243.1 head completion/stabilization protein [Dickeya solani]
MSMMFTDPVTDATPADVNDNGATVSSSSFWPVISLAALRKAMRLDGAVTTDKLMDKTVEAVGSVNDQLRDWRAEQERTGAVVLGDVEADEINGESVLVWRYRRAVYSTAKALLTEGYRDIDTTREGEKHAQALTSQIDTLWRDAQWAIRDIQGVGRGLAELV